jgi:hypothetical protein
MHEHHAEGALLQHAGKIAFAVADELALRGRMRDEVRELGEQFTRWRKRLQPRVGVPQELKPAQEGCLSGL